MKINNIKSTFLKKINKSLPFITGEKRIDDSSGFKGNIENYIGMAQVPIGMAGPLLINNGTRQYSTYVPLATSEGALVASYNRGMKACAISGDIVAVCLSEGVQRSPFFKFDNLIEAELFSQWVLAQQDTFEKIVKSTSNYASLINTKCDIEGNTVIVTFSFNTGDAAGQNMVTICSDQLCKYIQNNANPKPIHWYIESNYSGDKKATAVSLANGRGRKVSAEITIKREVVQSILKSEPEKMVDYWKHSTLATVKSGSIGAQGHVANALAALFIACGQDVACVSESAIGITRMELTAHEDLYASLTLPSIIVGTVGGGTTLPTQQECLSILDCIGVGKAKRFAEICCATALAGELSIAAALSADQFTKAHKDLGRK